MTDIEIWRTAVYDGEIYEGLYKVSNLGRILSLNYQNTGKAKLRTPSKRKDGYFQVGLRKNKKNENVFSSSSGCRNFLGKSRGETFYKS